MNLELYELKEFYNPLSGRSEIKLDYTGTGSTQTIDFLREHWLDLVMDDLIGRMKTCPQSILNHPSFSDFEALLKIHSDKFQR